MLICNNKFKTLNTNHYIYKREILEVGAITMKHREEDKYKGEEKYEDMGRGIHKEEIRVRIAEPNEDPEGERLWFQYMKP